MKSLKNALIYLTKFRELIETITRNISRFSTLTLIKWILSLMNMKRLHSLFSNGSQRHRKKEFKNSLKMKLKQHKRS